MASTFQVVLLGQAKNASVKIRSLIHYLYRSQLWHITTKEIIKTVEVTTVLLYGKFVKKVGVLHRENKVKYLTI